jgi:hypothetical protein
MVSFIRYLVTFILYNKIKPVRRRGGGRRGGGRRGGDRRRGFHLPSF